MARGERDNAPMKSKPKPNPKSAPPTQWSGVAQWYDDLVGESGSEYQQQVVFPGTLRLLGLQPGQRVIDIACGQGAFCRLLAGKGLEATGVDAAPELIRAARARGTAESAAALVHYHIGDARDLNFLPENHFDAAACVLAIQNIHPIAP